MRTYLEYFQLVFYALSLILNGVLLIIIIQKSPKEMGQYKYLLSIFVISDIIFTNVHYFTDPIVAIRGGIYFLFSETFPERWVISAYTTIHSHSFVLIFYHFIYRYIAVTRHHLVRLFKTWWFISLLVFFFLLESTLWFLLLFYQWETKQETFDQLFPLIELEFPNLTVDGIATADYWKVDSTLRMQPFLGWLGFFTFMTSVFSMVVFFGVQVFRYLNSIAQSKKTEAIQRQLFYTLIVQFSVPFLLMYSPVAFVITLPLLHISLDLPSRLISTFFVFFPVLDALVILIGIKDYRMVFIRLRGLKITISFQSPNMRSVNPMTSAQLSG